MNNKKRVVIIGAGPAGLTAALELLSQAGDKFDVVVLEGDTCVGGISRTVNVRGNRIDIGGHRFFSKSDWVMDWWAKVLPIRHECPADIEIFYQGKSRAVTALPTASSDEGGVFIIRERLSRILFGGQLFAYPLKPNIDTARKLGLIKCALFGLSYFRWRLMPVTPEVSLEDFFINRFGKRLYLQFFREYTEKVWGTTCDRISAEWGAQRIKGLSISSALRHAINKLFGRSPQVENTSLIERFLYPRLGPGQLWETVAKRVLEGGGRIAFEQTVDKVQLNKDNRVISLTSRDYSGQTTTYLADYVISTMPIKDLFASFDPPAPTQVSEIAHALEYRDFMTVGLLLKKISLEDESKSGNLVKDNWIYVQEPGVKVGRLQFFNNWSPDMVSDPNTVWIGLEYFCNEGDEVWTLPDEEMKALAAYELEKIGIALADDVMDSEVIRVKKAYPGYFGAYKNFSIIRTHLDMIENLFLVGRNGMHRYNNQDHSMLTAKLAVEAIVSCQTSKDAIWAVNIDDDYHEQK